MAVHTQQQMASNESLAQANTALYFNVVERLRVSAYACSKSQQLFRGHPKVHHKVAKIHLGSVLIGSHYLPPISRAHHSKVY
jgi:hypothetical protein